MNQKLTKGVLEDMLTNHPHKDKWIANFLTHKIIEPFEEAECIICGASEFSPDHCIYDVACPGPQPIGNVEDFGVF